MIKRRKIEVFSLSFLDCLCCGFAAILLIFLLSIGSGQAGDTNRIDLPTLQALRQQLATLETDIAEKTSLLETATNREQTARESRRITSLIQELESRLIDLRQEYESRKANLSTSKQASAEARRLIESFKYENLPPIGLPSDATHIAFVIDTSGSMRNHLTQQLYSGVIKQITELLNNLPEVGNFQFLDTSGNFMLSGRTGYWLPDTPGLRQQALHSILNYSTNSASDPEPGIRQALRQLKPQINPDDHMSLYVIGDDFRGNTESFLIKLDRLNPRNPSTNKRTVSISAVGFPTMVNPFQLNVPQGNVRFANIMREIAEKHNGVLILKPRI